MSAPAPRLVVDARRSAPSRVDATVRVVNEGAAAWAATLPTSERARVTAATDAGTRVFDSASGRLFLQVLTPLTVPPGASLTLTEEAFDAPVERVTVTARVPGTDLVARATA